MTLPDAFVKVITFTEYHSDIPLSAVCGASSPQQFFLQLRPESEIFFLQKSACYQVACMLFRCLTEDNSHERHMTPSKLYTQKCVSQCISRTFMQPFNLFPPAAYSTIILFDTCLLLLKLLICDSGHLASGRGLHPTEYLGNFLLANLLHHSENAGAEKHLKKK